MHLIVKLNEFRSTLVEDDDGRGFFKQPSFKSNYALTIKRAIQSIEKCDVQIMSGNHALELKLKYVGKSIADKIQNAIDEPSSREISVSANSQKSKGLISENPSAQSKSGSSTKRRESNRNFKPYVPRVRSGNYAILMAMATQPLNVTDTFYSKEQIIELAQPFTDSSFESSREQPFSAWSGIKKLVQMGLIRRFSHPAKFSITQSGLELVNTHFRKEPSISHLKMTPELYAVLGPQSQDLEICTSLKMNGVHSYIDQSLPMGIILYINERKCMSNSYVQGVIYRTLSTSPESIPFQFLGSTAIVIVEGSHESSNPCHSEIPILWTESLTHSISQMSSIYAHLKISGSHANVTVSTFLKRLEGTGPPDIKLHETMETQLEYLLDNPNPRVYQILEEYRCFADVFFDLNSKAIKKTNIPTCLIAFLTVNK